MCLALSLSLFACEKGGNATDTSAEPTARTTASITAERSNEGEYSEQSGGGESPFALDAVGVAVVHTETQKEFLAMENLYNVSRVADGKKEIGRPLPIRLSWKDYTDGRAVYTRVYISENEDLSDAYETITFGSETNVYNLKVGTKYYWKISAVYGNGETIDSNISSFTTEDECPRNIYVDGSTNWRDLGGWSAAGGKKVKQGLIYRTGRLNVSNADSMVAEITATGIKEAVSHLKIKTEIDLRGKSESSAITASVLGDNVKYYRCSMNYEGDLMTANAEKVREVFEILSDEDNYPVIFHCHIGTDRTGFVAYLINGLLGVSKQDLYKDYLFSNFGDIGGSRSMDDIAGRYVASLDDYAGKDLSEKIRNYLISVGVTEERINAVVSILL